MPENVNEMIVLEEFLKLCLASTTRRMEAIEKERAHLLAKRKRIEDHLEMLRLLNARKDESNNNNS